MVVMVPKGCCATSPMRVTHAGGRTPVLGTDPPGHGNVKQLNRRGSHGGSGISCNCFFMCVLSPRHGGVRMLLTREEKEVSYCVGYFYCGGRKDFHDRSWHSKTVCPRHSTPNYDTVQDSPFCKVLDTTSATTGPDLPSRSLARSPAG